MRWLGVDYGLRRIGIALGDPGERIASPATTLPGTGSDSGNADLILRWAAEHEVDGIVLGLPLNMDGTDSDQTRLCRSLANELRRRTQRPVELWDERLSTFQAECLLGEAGVRAARRKGRRDALAAQVILQAFLDARRNPPSSGAGG